MGTITEKSRSFISYITLGAATALFLTGCPIKPEDLCDGGVTNCQTGTYPYSCHNHWGRILASCQVDQTAANSWCAQHYGGSNSAEEIDCYLLDGDDEIGDETGDPEWDPGAYVTSTTPGEYNVDGALVGQIKNDFNILDNDQTRLVESAMTDYFELSGVVTGDLADVLGLQTGDILLSVNSNSLDGIEDAIDTYLEVENDSTLVLGFKRSNTVYYHTYYIFYTDP